MTQYLDSIDTERRAIARLLPFLKAWSVGAPLIQITDREGQRRRGDCIVTTSSGSVIDCELKGVEGSYDRFFIETWSNKAFGKPGWLFTSEAHRLLYLYLEDERLFVIDLPALKRWLIDEGHAERFIEVSQEKCSQLNDTWGRLVPQWEVRAAIGFRWEGIAPKETLPLSPEKFHNDHLCHCGEYGTWSNMTGPVENWVWLCNQHTVAKGASS